MTYAQGVRRHNFAVRWCDRRNGLEAVEGVEAWKAVENPDRQETSGTVRKTVLRLHHWYYCGFVSSISANQMGEPRQSRRRRKGKMNAHYQCHVDVDYLPRAGHRVHVDCDPEANALSELPLGEASVRVYYPLMV